MACGKPPTHFRARIVSIFTGVLIDDILPRRYVFMLQLDQVEVEFVPGALEYFVCLRVFRKQELNNIRLSAAATDESNNFEAGIYGDFVDVDNTVLVE